MSALEYERLKDDIRQHGVRLPVITLNGAIPDGRHRVRACRALGVDYQTLEANGSDPATVVASLNLFRRHLAPDQVVAIHELLAGEMAKKAEPQVRPERRRVGKESIEIAKQLGVGRATVERVREVKRKAPEQLREVAAGKRRAAAVLRNIKRTSRSTVAPPSTMTDTKGTAFVRAKTAVKEQPALKPLWTTTLKLARDKPSALPVMGAFYRALGEAIADGSLVRAVKGGAR
jgi:ParB-like chromosome segregation protein Spo0J